jgi:predicted DNA-binding transcriptional regulator AlpA
MSPVPDPQERPTLRIEEAAPFLGVGRSAAYIAAKNGQFPIPVIHIGARRIVVPTAALRRLLELDGGPDAAA